MVLAPLAPTNANNMATKENVTRLAADDSLFVDATTGVTAGIDPAMKAKYDEKIDLVGEFKRGWLGHRPRPWSHLTCAAALGLFGVLGEVVVSS